MKIRSNLLGAAAIVLFLLPSTAMAAGIGGNAVPKYSTGQIFSPSQTVDLIASTTAAGNVWAVRCIFSNSSDPVDVKFTVDSGTTHTITLDPLNFVEDSASNFDSGWVPLNVAFGTSIHVQIANGSVTGTINCWASWGTN